MMEYKVLETRPFVSALLEENEIVFFVGSGISMWDPSNSPTGYELKRNLFKGITSHKDLSVYFDGIYGDDVNNLIPNEQWQKVPLEGMFGAIYAEIGDRLFDGLTFFDSNKYNPIHKMLILLTDKTTHKTIFTTNFDLLFEACSPRSVKPIFNTLKDYPALNKINLIKLHGSYSDKSSIIMTLEREGTGLPVFLQNFLKSFLSGKVICFIGYSASEFDIVPLLSNIPFSKVYWVEKDEKAIQDNPRMLKILEKNNSFVGFDMRSIFQEIYSRKFSRSSTSLPWSHNDVSVSIIDFLTKELSPSQKFFITARIFRSILKINFALEILLKKRELVKSGKLTLNSALSNILNFEIAETYKEKGDYCKSKKYYLYYYKNLIKEQSKISTIKILQAKREIAKIHVLRHEFNKADNMLQELIDDISHELTQEDNNPSQLKSLLADCRKNYAMVRLAKIQKGIASRQELEQIEKLLKELYENGISEGNIDKQAEAKRFLARCKRIERKHEEAYRLLEEVLEYFQFVGRTMGGINTLREYANNLMMEKKFWKAIEIHKKLLRINKEFDEDYPTRLKSLWALVYLNLLSGHMLEAINYLSNSILLSLYYWISRKLTFSMIKDIAFNKALF